MSNKHLACLMTQISRRYPSYTRYAWKPVLHLGRSLKAATAFSLQIPSAKKNDQMADGITLRKRKSAERQPRNRFLPTAVG